ncbi:hypothetical protein D3C71_1942140 [compost metagenome]
MRPSGRPIEVRGLLRHDGSVDCQNVVVPVCQLAVIGDGLYGIAARRSNSGAEGDDFVVKQEP